MPDPALAGATLTRRLWRLDALYWATSRSGLVVCCPWWKRAYSAQIWAVWWAPETKVLAVFRCLHGGHEARADVDVAQNILVRGITAGCAGVAAFAAEAVKLAQAEGL